MRNMIWHLTRYHVFGSKNRYWIEVDDTAWPLDLETYDAIDTANDSRRFWADDAMPMGSRGNDFVIVWNW